MPSCFEGVTKQLVVRILAAKLVKKQDADTMAPSYFFYERFFLTLINIDDNFLITFVFPKSHARLRLLVAGDSGASSCSFACIH